MTKQIGVISDTHGLLREQVKSRLQGCDLILHAGDIGAASVLTELRQIAPVIAVRGNMDRGPWVEQLAEMECLEVGGCYICVIHDLSRLSLDAAAAGANAIIYGHSHKPTLEHRDGILYLNPGSAGPRRFRLPISMALLQIGPEGIVPTLIEL